LADGDFETLDDKGYPRGWRAPVKYCYFPSLHCSIFTWHNANAENRESRKGRGMRLSRRIEVLRRVRPTPAECSSGRLTAPLTGPGTRHTRTGAWPSPPRNGRPSPRPPRPPPPIRSHGILGARATRNPTVLM